MVVKGDVGARFRRTVANARDWRDLERIARLAVRSACLAPEKKMSELDQRTVEVAISERSFAVPVEREEDTTSELSEHRTLHVPQNDPVADYDVSVYPVPRT